MCVVKLNTDIIRKFVEIIALFQKTPDNILNSAGNKEILLNQTQCFPRFDGIGRI